MTRVLSLIAILSTLTLSFLLDRSSSYLKRAEIGPEQFEPEMVFPRIVGDNGANLVIVLVLLGLAWLVLSRFGKDALAAWIFILVGLFGMLYIPLVLIDPPGLQEFLTSSGFGVLTRGFRMTLMETGFGTYFVLGNAGVFIIGVFGLIGKGAHYQKEDHDENEAVIF